MTEIELSTGVVEYQDTGGTGPVLVLLHGILMNGSLWRDVVADLRTDHRAIVPTLPLGAHAHPVNADAELSLRGVARLVGELLAKLELTEVTLVGNDTGGAVAQLVVTDSPARVARLVLASCEAFDNFPPGPPGKTSALVGKLPGAMWLAAQQMRLAPFRRLPITYGWMAKRPIPTEIVDSWFAPVRANRTTRRDFARLLKTGDPRAELTAAAAALPTFDRPALVVWAGDDRLMPTDHGRRLAELLPKAEFTEIPDSYTLIPLDQPTALAAALRRFVKEHS